MHRWIPPCILLLVLGACDSDREKASAPPPPSASARVPVDRLAPGELQPGTEKAYGLVLPRKLKVIQRFSDAVHAAGPLKAEDVANYIRKRVSVYRVELGATGTIFPDAKIRGGDKQRTYRITVSAVGRDRSKIAIEDVTPPPKVEGLSESERWKRAGIDPRTGRPLNPNEAE